MSAPGRIRRLHATTSRATTGIRPLLHQVVVNGLLASGVIPTEVRWLFYRAVGLKIGKSRICSKCFFGTGDVFIGRGTYINHGAFIDTVDLVTIGENVSFGMRVMIVTSSHEIGDSRSRAGILTGSPVTIGAGSWIGANTTVLPGVSIGPGCIIASGSVVSTDCAPNGLYAGVPAVRKKDLSP